jgi:hypothetical protein
VSSSVLLIGLGGLGSVLLEFLAREPDISRIITADRDAERGVARCNLARVGALAQGFSPEIQFITLDLNQEEDVAKTIDSLNPSIILCAASMMTWWLPGVLPEEAAQCLGRIGFGAWLPLHLDLPIKLMRAVNLANYQGHVLMAPYPDVVNPVLGSIDLAPTCGVGNLDEIIPKIQLLAGNKLGVTPVQIRVHLVAHHALQAWVFGSRRDPHPPFYLRVEHEGKDVTEEVEAQTLLLSSYPIPQDHAWHFLTAASTLRLLRALLSDDERDMHVPGPSGLPGGYPAKVSRSGVNVALPPDLTLEEAIDINQRSHPFDGIERIQSDGSVIFTTETAQIMRDELGYDCSRLLVNEVTERALELIRLLSDYAAEHGVESPL